MDYALDFLRKMIVSANSLVTLLRVIPKIKYIWKFLRQTWPVPYFVMFQTKKTPLPSSNAGLSSTNTSKEEHTLRLPFDSSNQTATHLAKKIQTVNLEAIGRFEDPTVSILTMKKWKLSNGYSIFYFRSWQEKMSNLFQKSQASLVETCYAGRKTDASANKAEADQKIPSLRACYMPKSKVDS